METTKRLYVHFVLADKRFKRPLTIKRRLCLLLTQKPILSNYDKLLKYHCKKTIQKDIHLSAERIEKVVCQYFNKASKEIRRKTKLPEIVKCRQIIMYLLQIKLKWSYRESGAWFNQNRATGRYAFNRVYDLMEVYPEFKNDIIKIRQKL